MQTSGSVFAGRIEKVKKSQFELEVIKIVDCFFDGHGNYDSSLKSSNWNLYNRQKFLLQLARVPKENKMLVKNETSMQKSLKYCQNLN